MMLDHIRDLINLVDEASDEKFDVPRHYSKVANVVISGMGGSGIAGDVVRDLTEDTVAKPVLVCRRLHLPAFADEKTLLISMSYSGNTVETVSAFKDGLSRGCRIVGVTGGGRLERLFNENGIPYAKLPAGYLPREAMPRMLAILLGVFKNLGWIKSRPHLDELASRREAIERGAQRVAKRLRGKTVIIYTKYPSVAHRFKSQLNENSKTLAKYDIIPELAHNEINSWSNLEDSFHIVFMRNLREPRVVTRMVEIMKRLLKEEQYTEIIARGRDLTNRLLYLIWFGDFVSYYLALENKVNPERVYATEFLKTKLAQSQ